MTHVMFDENMFYDEYDFDTHYKDIDKYLLDLMYPSPKPTLLPEFDPFDDLSYKNEPSIFSKFLILIGVVQLGVFLGFTVTSLIYNYMIDWSIEKDDYDVEEIPYEKKYRFKNIDHNNMPSDNTYIQDLTPDGMVFMSYDKKEEGFIYWADNNIRFSYLETVARKFVNCFSCNQLYIERECNKDSDSDYSDDSGSDSQQEQTQQEESQQEQTQQEESQQEQTQQEETNKKPSPFAELKNYNKRSTQQDSKDEKDRDNKKVNTSCKFVKKGKLCDFKITQDLVVDEPKQKLTFASFKAMFINTSEE